MTLLAFRLPEINGGQFTWDESFLSNGSSCPVMTLLGIRRHEWRSVHVACVICDKWVTVSRYERVWDRETPASAAPVLSEHGLKAISAGESSLAALRGDKIRP